MEAIPRCSYYQISTSDPISHSPTQRGKGLIPLTEKQGREEPHLEVKAPESGKRKHDLTSLFLIRELDSWRLFWWSQIEIA